MPVYRKIPKLFYPCKDGTYSDHKRQRACTWHDGLKSKEAIKTQQGSGSKQNIIDIPLQGLFLAEQWFQNRANHFSTRTVDNIVTAYKEGNFRWTNFDPITVWQNPQDGKMYVLSGHSRTEAFSRLCSLKAKAQGKTFCSIPAKVVKNISLEEAKNIALESNTLSTPETDLERAAYYRKMRIEENQPITNLKKTGQRLEGRNANHIIALSFLHPSGKTFSALAAMETGHQTSKTNIHNIARWIGNARMSLPLTDQHENEIYIWLVTHKGYGTGKGQISNEREFKSRLGSIVNRRTTFGVLDESLNIQNTLQQSPTERQYNQRIQEASANIRQIEKQIKDKIKELTSRGATETQIQKITAGLEATLRRSRINYQTLIQKKSEVSQHARKEKGLFDGLNGLTSKRSNIYHINNFNLKTL